LRVVAERFLGRVGRGFLRTRAAGGRAAILAYHNVVPDGLPPAGDDGLHLPRGAFARQLDLLQQCCEVVPLESLLGPKPRTDRLVVAITFDDAYRGALTLGSEELARRGLPATMFVPPGLLEDRSFWWDDLAEGQQGLADQIRARALGELHGVDQAIRAAFPRTPPVQPAFMRSATVSELVQAAGQGIWRFAPHSWSHPDLRALGPAELNEELLRPLAWLRERFPGVTISWLAYPYGLTSAVVQAAAAAAGFAGGLRVEGGPFRLGHPTPLALPRVSVPAGVSLDGFALRLAGFRP
jgi:peptidoglycan/xylan/chitin deacetylase (PgdA/CDA1 family)